MIIKNCPICGRKPYISECVRDADGTRRRMCGCRRYDTVITTPDGERNSFFVFRGDGDDNAIFSVWNKFVDKYVQNKDKPSSGQNLSVVDERVELRRY